MRIALIYDDVVRPDTTGVHCYQALAGLCEVKHFSPHDLDSIPGTGFDLYLNIDDGLQYRLPDRLRPSAWWVIDTHLNYAWDVRKAVDFDYVFAAQRDGSRRLKADGITSATWLPLACNPRYHRRHAEAKCHDVCFVGSLLPGERTRLVGLLQERFEHVFVGQAYCDDMARAYSRSRLVFNRSVGNDVNMRVFEAVACGSLLITNDLADNGQEDLLRHGEHLVTYRDDAELLERVRYYLTRGEERERIATRGMEEVHAHHTYLDRMRQLLQATALDPDTAPHTTDLVAPHYHDFPRPELVALIPEETSCMLDVGCGAGHMGALLKSRQSCQVVGIEQSPGPAAEAKSRLDRVIVGDVENVCLDLGEDAFDCIVFGDVLEHLRDPDRTMVRLCRYLRPEGTVVASIPNIRNCQVLRDLGAGFWSPEPAGLLDRTHLRFFTLPEILRLFAGSGLQVEHIERVMDPQVATWRAAGRPSGLQMGSVGLKLSDADEAEELFVVQYLLRARPRQARRQRLTSIIILVWNELAYSQLCIESVLRHTSEPFELIIVDNGSTDGTTEWLNTIPRATVIHNERNVGFPKGVNQGLEAARGEYLVLLNNDTIVSAGWLDRLVSCLESDPDAGMVGPVTNEVSGEQRISVPYDNAAQIGAFAAHHAYRHNGEKQETNRLVGFCLLMRRDRLELLGNLDESYGLGTFEDDDLCLRMRRAGYRLLIAHDCFVHHFGSRTFLGQGVDAQALLATNCQHFGAKFGITPQQAATGDRYAPRVGDASRPTLSLCMIVRDEEANIATCLRSIQPWVDEMIVVDTGSSDHTVEIAQACGAQVEHFPWCDDFSAARNESLRHATGDWIFWMDADDVIDGHNGARLRQLISEAGEEVFGITVQVHCPPRPGEDAGVEVVDHVKLLRNHPAVRFEFHIHEQVLPSIRRLGKQVVYGDAYVTHAGYDVSPAGQQRKRKRDLKLLHLDLQAHPDHPFIHFNMGMTAFHLGNMEQARHHLSESISLAAPDESHVRKAYALLASCYRRDQDWVRARQTCDQGLAACPDDPELLFNQAIVCHHLGELVAAERSYRRILDQAAPEPYLRSVDAGIMGFKSRHNLALLYLDMRRPGDAESSLREAIAEEPAFAPSWFALGDLLRSANRQADLESLVQELVQFPETSALGSLLMAWLRYNDGEWDAARELLEHVPATALGPNLLRARQLLSHALLRLGRVEEAVPVLREVLQLSPDNEEAHCNLVLALSELGQPAAAWAAVQDALLVHPVSARLNALVSGLTPNAKEPSASRDNPASPEP